jgi:CDGSH-type Zn-finger protein
MTEDAVAKKKQVPPNPAARELPVSPQRGPFIVSVVEGQRYRWCSCGLSKIQPWCDDSHAGTEFEPIEFEAALSGEFHMCGCKRSDNKPYCFGNCRGHNRLADQR